MSGMSRADRAKQFMPFAALKGFEEALAEVEKPVFDRIILGEDAQTELDMALRALRIGDEVCLRYYLDSSYVNRTGPVSGIDPNKRLIFLSDLPIPIDDIIDIKQGSM